MKARYSKILGDNFLIFYTYYLPISCLDLYVPLDEELGVSHQYLLVVVQIIHDLPNAFSFVIMCHN